MAIRYTITDALLLPRLLRLTPCLIISAFAMSLSLPFRGYAYDATLPPLLPLRRRLLIDVMLMIFRFRCFSPRVAMPLLLPCR